MQKWTINFYMVNRCMIFPKSDPKGRSCYMGEFAGGLMHGVGVLYFQQHETRYEGQFQKGMVNILAVSHSKASSTPESHEVQC